MDSSTGQLPVFNFEVRGRIPTSTINLSRESLMAFSGWETPYHGRMDDNMDCDSMIGDLTPELSYKTEQEKVLHVSKAADQHEPMSVKIADDGLYFIFSFHFILFSLFSFLFLFLFIEQLRLGFISHAVTSVTN